MHENFGYPRNMKPCPTRQGSVAVAYCIRSVKQSMTQVIDVEAP